MQGGDHADEERQGGHPNIHGPKVDTQGEEDELICAINLQMDLPLELIGKCVPFACLIKGIVHNGVGFGKSLAF
jgi:hypothetical protein